MVDTIAFLLCDLAKLGSGDRSIKEGATVVVYTLEDPKNLSIAKSHPKPSQEFSEQFGPSTHKMMGF